MVGGGAGGGGGGALERNVCLGKNFAYPTIRKSYFCIPNLKYQLKSKYPPLAKLCKRLAFMCYTCPLPLLWHEFDNHLRNFLHCEVSCCLHMYFLWRHHLHPDKSENDQDWFRYCMDIWLLTLLFDIPNIWVSHALEMTINFYYATLELFCFSFTQPITQNFVYPTLFSSIPLTPPP